MKKPITLTYWEGYLSMFTFLEKTIEKNNRKKSLEKLLKNMDPDALVNQNLPEKTMLLDWLKVIKTDDFLKEEVDVEECYRCMIAYIVLEEKKGGFHFNRFIQSLVKAYSNRKNNQLWMLWIDSCMLAKV